VTRTDRTRREDPARADGYAEVGRRLLVAGRSILAQHDPRHASALAVLAVHAGIAFADAVCIRKGGRKSASSDHAAAVRLLRATLGNRLPLATERALDRLLAAKERLEYQGFVVPMREAATIFELGERCAAWAERELVT